MPFTVQQLIEDHQKVITASPDLSAKQALKLMIQHDFSQLPVVDANNSILGIVTSNSILRALNNFEIPLADLRVLHAIAKVKRYKPDDDLFDLLDALKDTYAVLIVQNDGTLKGVITSYDTTEYFRRHAEDIMYVKDIENTVKDFIHIAFDNIDDTNECPLDQAITEGINPDSRKKLRSALSHYLNRVAQKTVTIDQDLFEEVFTKHFSAKNNSAKSFNDLTLYEYIQLMLHKSKWSAFNSAFQLGSDGMRNLLNGVRETRNALAHFHGEISPTQRAQLHFCAEWLEQRRSAVLDAFQANPSAAEVQQEIILTSSPENTINDMLLVEEDIKATDSRYAPLAIWLQQRPLTQGKVLLTFKQIEEILGEELPTSARQHRSWWANDSVGHVQSQQWLEVGWRVANVSIINEEVTFMRIKGREKLYLDFYSELLAKLASTTEFPTRGVSLDGVSWVVLRQVPGTGPAVGFLTFAFARGKRFRVEFYIGSGDQGQNKSLFDKLYAHKNKIQEALEGVPGSLEWQRLDNRRASRIGFYHKGAITNSPAELAQLREWAVGAMIKFQKVIDQQVGEVLLTQQVEDVVEQRLDNNL